MIVGATAPAGKLLLTEVSLPGKVLLPEGTDMNVGEALEQIDSIHEHLAKAEEYRGYRPLALVVSGVLGLLAGFVQPWLVTTGDPAGFVSYWLALACVCGAVAGGATLFGYVAHEDEFSRRRTRTVMRQFVPCLLAGAVVTVALSRAERPDAVSLLPGLWSLLYGLGALASLPYLPRLAGAVAAWYLAVGGLLLLVDSGPLAGWSVGVPFGVGQMLAGAVMFVARRPEEKQ
jgi:uncharacterized membrane protein YeaQ/YmgE (transglycosylase-associated protein family)